MKINFTLFIACLVASIVGATSYGQTVKHEDALDKSEINAIQPPLRPVKVNAADYPMAKTNLKTIQNKQSISPPNYAILDKIKYLKAQQCCAEEILKLEELLQDLNQK